MKKLLAQTTSERELILLLKSEGFFILRKSKLELLITVPTIDLRTLDFSSSEMYFKSSSFKELKDEIGKWMYSIEWLLTHKAIIFKSNNIYFDLGLELEHLGFYSVDVQFEDTNQVSVECSFELLDGTPRHIAITGIQDKFMVYDKLIKLIKNYGGIKRIQKHSFFIFN